MPIEYPPLPINDVDEQGNGVFRFDPTSRQQLQLHSNTVYFNVPANCDQSMSTGTGDRRRIGICSENYPQHFSQTPRVLEKTTSYHEPISYLPVAGIGAANYSNLQHPMGIQQQHTMYSFNQPTTIPASIVENTPSMVYPTSDNLELLPPAYIIPVPPGYTVPSVYTVGNPSGQHSWNNQQFPPDILTPPPSQPPQYWQPQQQVQVYQNQEGMFYQQNATFGQRVGGHPYPIGNNNSVPFQTFATPTQCVTNSSLPSFPLNQMTPVNHVTSSTSNCNNNQMNSADFQRNVTKVNSYRTTNTARQKRRPLPYSGYNNTTGVSDLDRSKSYHCSERQLNFHPAPSQPPEYWQPRQQVHSYLNQGLRLYQQNENFGHGVGGQPYPVENNYSVPFQTFATPIRCVADTSLPSFPEHQRTSVNRVTSSELHCYNNPTNSSGFQRNVTKVKSYRNINEAGQSRRDLPYSGYNGGLRLEMQDAIHLVKAHTNSRNSRETRPQIRTTNRMQTNTKYENPSILNNQRRSHLEINATLSNPGISENISHRIAPLITDPARNISRNNNETIRANDFTSCRSASARSLNPIIKPQTLMPTHENFPSAQEEIRNENLVSKVDFLKVCVEKPLSGCEKQNKMSLMLLNDLQSPEQKNSTARAEMNNTVEIPIEATNEIGKKPINNMSTRDSPSPSNHTKQEESVIDTSKMLTKGSIKRADRRKRQIERESRKEEIIECQEGLPASNNTETKALMTINGLQAVEEAVPQKSEKKDKEAELSSNDSEKTLLSEKHDSVEKMNTKKGDKMKNEHASLKKQKGKKGEHKPAIEESIELPEEGQKIEGKNKKKRKANKQNIPLIEDESSQLSLFKNYEGEIVYKWRYDPSIVISTDKSVILKRQAKKKLRKWKRGVHRNAKENLHNLTAAQANEESQKLEVDCTRYALDISIYCESLVRIRQSSKALSFYDSDLSIFGVTPVGIGKQISDFWSSRPFETTDEQHEKFVNYIEKKLAFYEDRKDKYQTVMFNFFSAMLIFKNEYLYQDIIWLQSLNLRGGKEKTMLNDYLKMIKNIVPLYTRDEIPFRYPTLEVLQTNNKIRLPATYISHFCKYITTQFKLRYMATSTDSILNIEYDKDGMSIPYQYVSNLPCTSEQTKTKLIMKLEEALEKGTSPKALLYQKFYKFLLQFKSSIIESDVYHINNGLFGKNSDTTCKTTESDRQDVFTLWFGHIDDDDDEPRRVVKKQVVPDYPPPEYSPPGHTPSIPHIS